MHDSVHLNVFSIPVDKISITKSKKIGTTLMKIVRHCLNIRSNPIFFALSNGLYQPEQGNNLHCCVFIIICFCAFSLMNNSFFIQGCSPPPSPSSGARMVSADGHQAHYSCDVGFSLKGLQIRNCVLTTAEWEDVDPECGMVLAILTKLTEWSLPSFDNWTSPFRIVG